VGQPRGPFANAIALAWSLGQNSGSARARDVRAMTRSPTSRLSGASAVPKRVLTSLSLERCPHRAILQPQLARITGRRGRGRGTAHVTWRDGDALALTVDDRSRDRALDGGRRLRHLRGVAGVARPHRHFAPGQHGIFSVRNSQGGSNPRVSRADIAAAQTENWWGKAITVTPEQIFEPR
jgi:hypothetical protein